MRAIVAERDQVIIPKALRYRLGIAPATVLEFAAEKGGLVATKIVDDHPAPQRMGRHGKGYRTAAIYCIARAEMMLPSSRRKRYSKTLPHSACASMPYARTRH